MDRETNDPAQLQQALELMNQQLQQLTKQMVSIQNHLSKASLNPIAPGSLSSTVQSANKSEGKKEPEAQKNSFTKTETLVSDMEKKSRAYFKNGDSNYSKNSSEYFLEPPVPGAKLGKDQNGNPAWFLENPDKPGSYFQLID
jgi:hypothetical protein